jgi:hypothetical protein
MPSAGPSPTATQATGATIEAAAGIERGTGEVEKAGNRRIDEAAKLGQQSAGTASRVTRKRRLD